MAQVKTQAKRKPYLQRQCRRLEHAARRHPDPDDSGEGAAAVTVVAATTEAPLQRGARRRVGRQAA